MRSKRRSGAGSRQCSLATTLVFGLLAASGGILPVHAAIPDSSYWGGASALDDSMGVLFTQPGLPAWEAAVVYPWRVITYPIKLVGLGIGAAVRAGEESRFARGKPDGATKPKRDVGIEPEFIAGGGLDGFGGGLTIYDNSFRRPGTLARIGAEFTSNGSKRFRLGLLFRDGRTTSLEVGAGYRLKRSARYFGLGPTSTAEDESYYGLETTWGGIGVNRRLGDHSSLYLTAMATAVGTERPFGPPDKALETVFAGRLPYGYGQRSDGGSLGVDFSAGEPRSFVRPDDEGLVRLRLAWFDDWNAGSAPYWSGLLMARRFLPLWNSAQTLGLRGQASWSTPTGQGEIPFQRLNSNYEIHRLRGYQDYRFTDRGLLLLTAEYRWPMWVTREADGAGLDMILLTDFGQVFHDIGQITTDHLTASYGLALELAGVEGLLARIEFGWSEEETVVRFGLLSLAETGFHQVFRGRDVDGGP